MTEEKPIVTILRGDDREKIESLIRKYYKELGQQDWAEMNTTHLDGSSADLNDLRAAALALPFLCERRLVIVENALRAFSKEPQKGEDQEEVQTVDDKVDKKEKEEKFTALLDSLPGSTMLVLVIPDQKKNLKRNGVWESVWVKLNDKHWLIQWAQGAGSRVKIEDCLLPTGGQMATWVTQKAQALGGNFTPDAAKRLAEYVGNDTLRATQEINKLLTYANFTRPINNQDVEALCFNYVQVDIFELVDAIGQRDGEAAIRLFHILLEEMDFSYDLFPMVIRQFRLLIQAREILDMGGTERDLIKTLGLHQFVARKIQAQAQKFDLLTLEGIYHHLLKIDIGQKTSQMPGEVALDLLIARLAS